MYCHNQINKRKQVTKLSQNFNVELAEIYFRKETVIVYQCETNYFEICNNCKTYQSEYVYNTRFFYRL